MMNDISGILVANRGEIACRIMRTVQSMGINAIAVYSDADAETPHVKIADQAINIGPPPVDQSYLVIEKIIEAAQQSGADAIHPGYGFLSENADFAKACAQNNIIFIGPSPEAIEIMGSKAASKAKMQEVGVPCVPGYNGEDQSNDALMEAANAIGFPIMVKASAGGGGRGMRLVESANDLVAALDLARSEAKNAFSNDHLILEKAVQNPRHIEIQVFGDSHGTIVHMGERDCSIQRRHQKIIEEAPSPAVDENLRSEMGAAAVKAAQAVDYIGAGTVEFLLDDNGAFYFLEMNTRLQVEHPVSELVTGYDFVELQIDIARGKSLPMTQEQIMFSGHAIEARVYCEDPENGFLPATGHVDFWRTSSDQGIRTDDGIHSGVDVSPHYDPMIAKVISYGRSRDITLKKLTKALGETTLFGPKNNLEFLIGCLRKNSFKEGAATTSFIRQEFSGGQYKRTALSKQTLAAAAVIEHELNLAINDSAGPLKNWASAGSLTSRSQYLIGGEITDIAVAPVDATNYTVHIGDIQISIGVESFQANDAILNADDERLKATYHQIGEGDFWLNIDGATKRFQNQIYMPSSASDSAQKGAAVAPMHGLLTDIMVQEGDIVKPGQTLAVLEAMKMQHEIKSTVHGTIKAVHAVSGKQVAPDSLLIEIEPSDDGTGAS
jgi:geranyl-CoA carboxylase alpha subunit